MRAHYWLQLALFLGILAAITKPIGIYLTKVLDPDGKTWLDPVLRPVEKFTYHLMGVKPGEEQDWKGYTLAMLLFSLVGMGGSLYRLIWSLKKFEPRNGPDREG